MQLRDALAKAQRQMAADGRSPLTAGQYRRHIGLLDRWLVARGYSREVEEIGHETLAEFLTDDVARRKADGRVKTTGSMNALRTSLRAFFLYCHSAGFTPANPARLIRRACCAPPPPRTLSDGEVTQLLAAADALKGMRAARDRMLVRLLLGTGLRLSSAINLRVRDLDLERGEMRILNAKGDRPMALPISAEVARELADYLRTLKGPMGLPRSPGPATPPVGCREADQRMRRGRRARTRSHRARAPPHLRGGGLYRRTGEILAVQAALGHRSLNSTSVYVRLDDRMLRAALRA